MLINFNHYKNTQHTQIKVYSDQVDVQLGQQKNLKKKRNENVYCRYIFVQIFATKKLDFFKNTDMMLFLFENTQVRPFSLRNNSCQYL